MLVYCTYCSADKHFLDARVPAIELYKSHRIAEVFNLAKDAGTAFLILSGKYGIIGPNERIEHYDHLLKSSEIELHSDKIAKQINSINISSIVFFMRSVDKDKNLQAYLDCISRACEKATIKLEVRVSEFHD